MKTLKIFTYKEKNGELVKENLYSDFLFVFNEVISYNYLHEKDKLNIIVGTEYPPRNLTFKNSKWESKDNIIIKEYGSFLKNFE
jgi:hypothetical protein